MVVRAGALGDFLLGVPALRALRERYPDAAIHLVGPLPQARLALHLGLARWVTGVDAPEVARLFLEGADLAPLEDTFGRVGLAVVWLRRSDAVAGNLARLGSGRVIAAPPFPEPGSRTHVADWLLESLRPADVRPRPGWDQAAWLSAPGEARLWAARWLDAHLAGEPFIALHPGSGSARKNWDAAAWAFVVQQLRRRRGLRVVVTAGPADEAAWLALRHAFSKRSGALPDAALAGAELPHLAALLERATLYLGNDSGVTHLAAGLGVRTVAVFGPTDPATWRPRGPRVRALGGTPSPAGTAGDLPAEVQVRWPAPEAAVEAAEALLAV